MICAAKSHFFKPMQSESFARTAISFFLVILGGSLVSALLGGVFAYIVAVISPEFVQNLFGVEEGNEARYAASTGMIWGIFIGAAVSGFSCFLAVIIRVVKLQIDFKKGDAK